jgi:excisionase family DNA binding protein
MAKLITMTNLITGKQAAEQLNVSRNTIYAWISTGKLRAHQVGNYQMINPKDLAKVVKDKRGRPRAGAEKKQDTPSVSRFDRLVNALNAKGAGVEIVEDKRGRPRAVQA